MRITQETDYAFRIVEYLALNVGQVVDSTTLSQDLVIPQRFTLKILRKLNLAGITDAIRGVKGGYYLKKQPRNISYKDVIEAIEGKICINKCLSDPNNCSRGKSHKCYVHTNLSKLQLTINKELERFNFDIKGK